MEKARPLGFIARGGMTSRCNPARLGMIAPLAWRDDGAPRMLRPLAQGPGVGHARCAALRNARKSDAFIACASHFGCSRSIPISARRLKSLPASGARLFSARTIVLGGDSRARARRGHSFCFRKQADFRLSCWTRTGSLPPDPHWSRLASCSRLGSGQLVAVAAWSSRLPVCPAIHRRTLCAVLAKLSGKHALAPCGPICLPTRHSVRQPITCSSCAAVNSQSCFVSGARQGAGRDPPTGRSQRWSEPRAWPLYQMVAGNRGVAKHGSWQPKRGNCRRRLHRLPQGG